MILSPTLPYAGLTLILDNPSRFDSTTLLTGTAGEVVRRALNPLSTQQIEIRTADISSPLRSGTKCVLLCGDKSLSSIGEQLPLGDARGCPITRDNIVYVPTFYPQDACDPRDYEAAFNPNDADYGSSQDDDSDEDDSDVKGHSKTRRKNWKFWLTKDIAKAVRITTKGLYPTPSYDINIFPTYSTLRDYLRSSIGNSLVLDIETKINEQKTLLCIGVHFTNSSSVFTFPIFRYDGELAYPNTGQILRDLCFAITHNEIIAHNSCFDLFVLMWKYHLTFGPRIYDTMLAIHRCFPETEKSLGHAISLFTDLPYHKGEGIFNPHNHAQELQLWNYNAKDIVATIEVKKAIDIYAKDIYGLSESIAQANAMIRPYLITSMKGLAYNDNLRMKMIGEATRWKTQYTRMLRILAGRDINPNSWKQVSDYLYSPRPVGCGIKKPLKDPTNEKTLRQVLLKHTQCMGIVPLLKSRGVSKEASMLEFNPWKQ